MTVKRRGIRRYLCWLCGKDLQITTPPYQRGRHNVCRCEEEGLQGGSGVPYGLTEEEAEKARQGYAQTHQD